MTAKARTGFNVLFQTSGRNAARLTWRVCVGLLFAWWVAHSSVEAAPLGDYVREGTCNPRGAMADVVLTPELFRFGETTCRLLGPWTQEHFETGTLSVLVTGCGQEDYPLLHSKLRTTPLSTGRILFSLNQPRAVFSAKLCRHLPPVPRRKP